MEGFLRYRIGGLIFGGAYFNGIIRGKAISRGRRLFQTLLIRSCALNVLFYSPIEKKNDHIK